MWIIGSIMAGYILAIRAYICSAMRGVRVMPAHREERLRSSLHRFFISVFSAALRASFPSHSQLFLDLGGFVAHQDDDALYCLVAFKAQINAFGNFVEWGVWPYVDDDVL